MLDDVDEGPEGVLLVHEEQGDGGDAVEPLQQEKDFRFSSVVSSFSHGSSSLEIESCQSSYFILMVVRFIKGHGTRKGG